MKKYLNVLCIVMLVLMATDLIMPIVVDCNEMAEAFREGWEEGRNARTMSPFNSMTEWLMVVVGVPVFFVAVVSFVSFVRFILNVNRDKVFVWNNVPLLRWAGWGLLAGDVWLIVFSLLSNEPAAQVCMENSMGVILGVFQLIVAEVFAIGLKLKEDQDLTI